MANGRAGGPGEAGGERLGAAVTDGILRGRREGVRRSQEALTTPGLDGQPGEELDSAMPRDQFPGAAAPLDQFKKNCFSSIRTVMNIHRSHSRM